MGRSPQDVPPAEKPGTPFMIIEFDIKVSHKKYFCFVYFCYFLLPQFLISKELRSLIQKSEIFLTSKTGNTEKVKHAQG